MTRPGGGVGEISRPGHGLKERCLMEYRQGTVRSIRHRVPAPFLAMLGMMTSGCWFNLGVGWNFSRESNTDGASLILGATIRPSSEGGIVYRFQGSGIETASGEYAAVMELAVGLTSPRDALVAKHFWPEKYGLVGNTGSFRGAGASIRVAAVDWDYERAWSVAGYVHAGRWLSPGLGPPLGIEIRGQLGTSFSLNGNELGLNTISVLLHVVPFVR